MTDRFELTRERIRAEFNAKRDATYRERVDSILKEREGDSPEVGTLRTEGRHLDSQLRPTPDMPKLRPVGPIREASDRDAHFQLVRRFERVISKLAEHDGIALTNDKEDNQRQM